MPLYPDVSSEKSEKLKAISDEIGKITKKLIGAAETGDPIDPDDELRLKELKKELEILSGRRMGYNDGRDPGANPQAL